MGRISIHNFHPSLSANSKFWNSVLFKASILASQDMSHVKISDIVFATFEQRQKNLGSRVALLPRKFLRVWKVFARINEKTF